MRADGDQLAELAKLFESETLRPIHPEGAPAWDLPAQEGVFAPNYEVEEIAEIAQRLRQKAGLPDEPTGTVANEK